MEGVEKEARGGVPEAAHPPAIPNDNDEKGKGKGHVSQCNFSEWEGRPILALAGSKSGAFLAVARSNNDVEIWRSQPVWYLEKRLYGDADDIRSIVWVGEDRLITAGLSGSIVEWDIFKQTKKVRTDSYGGPVWSLGLNHTATTLAAGCEEGRVSLFDVSHGSLTYVQTLQPAGSGRLLALQWLPDDASFMTGGSDGNIRKWEIKKRRSTSQMVVGSTLRPSVVWALLVLGDGTLVSGDSTGATSFWDIKTSTLVKEFINHEADVLTLAADQTQTMIFSAGIDHKICQFCLVQPPQGDDTPPTWVYAHAIRAHTHDINALALLDNTLVSAGVDTCIRLYDTRRFKDMQEANFSIFPYPHHALVHMSSFPARRALCQDDYCLDLWAIALPIPDDPENGDVNSGEYADNISRPLVRIVPKNNGLRIVTSGLSPNGRFVACSDVRRTRLYFINSSSQSAYPTIKYIKLPAEIAPALRIVFTQDSSLMIIATRERKLQVIKLDSYPQLVGEMLHANPADHNSVFTAKSEKLGAITTIAVSSDNKWIASGDTDNKIHIFNLTTLEYHTTMPMLDSLHTTFAFIPDDSTLVVITLVNKFYLYDLNENTMGDWTRTFVNQLPDNFIQDKFPVTRIFFNPSQPRVLYFHRCNSVTRMDISKAPRREIKNEQGDIVHFKSTLQTIVNVPEMIFAGFLGPNELVFMDRRYKEMLPSLPPAFIPKRHYGQ